MKIAKLRIFWEPSPSFDVIEYKVLLTNEDNQETILEKAVSFAEVEIFAEVPENTNITATIIASDGVFDSDPTSISYNVGDLTFPQPIPTLGIEMVSVTEINDIEIPPSLV